jgi:hypothetical protein
VDGCLLESVASVGGCKRGKEGEDSKMIKGGILAHRLFATLSDVWYIHEIDFVRFNWLSSVCPVLALVQTQNPILSHKFSSHQANRKPLSSQNVRYTIELQ